MDRANRIADAIARGTGRALGFCLSIAIMWAVFTLLDKIAKIFA